MHDGEVSGRKKSDGRISGPSDSLVVNKGIIQERWLMWKSGWWWQIRHAVLLQGKDGRGEKHEKSVLKVRMLS